MIDLNATQAAIRAGYSARSANTQAARLLANVNIRARVDALMAQRSRRVGVSADRVVRELARLAFVSAPDVVDSGSGAVRPGASEDDLAAIASVRVKTATFDAGDSVEREVKLCDKLKALELLGKHLGMFDKKESKDISGVTIVLEPREAGS